MLNFTFSRKYEVPAEQAQPFCEARRVTREGKGLGRSLEEKKNPRGEDFRDRTA